MPYSTLMYCALLLFRNMLCTVLMVILLLILIMIMLLILILKQHVHIIIW